MHGPCGVLRPGMGGKALPNRGKCMNLSIYFQEEFTVFGRKKSEKKSYVIFFIYQIGKE